MIHEDSTNIPRVTIHGTPNPEQEILKAQPRIQQRKVSKIRKGLAGNAQIQTPIKTISNTPTPIIFCGKDRITNVATKHTTSGGIKSK